MYIFFFFTTQGHITPKWFISSGPTSNLSEILCLSLLLVSLMETEFRVTEKRWIHHFLHYKSMGENQRSRANNSKVNNLIWLKFELIRNFMPVSLPASLTNILSKVTEKSYRQFFFHNSRTYNSKEIRFGRNSNPSNISYLSLLPVSLMKIEFIVTDKMWRHFLHYKYMGEKTRSRVNNSKVSNPVTRRFGTKPFRPLDVSAPRRFGPRRFGPRRFGTKLA